jgi:hypothetical protein
MTFRAAASGDGGAAAFPCGPVPFANVIPVPGTIPGDDVTLAATMRGTSTGAASAQASALRDSRAAS